MFGEFFLVWSAFAGLCYVGDVLVRPHLVAQEAIAYARRRGKPVLNVGCGTERSSLRALLFGPTLWGDVNLDLAGDPATSCSPNTVCFGNAEDLSRFPDKYFGSAIASHVLEHVPDPRRMMSEMARVAERVYLVCPPVEAPHSLLYHDHRWQVSDRHACALVWNPDKPVGECIELPYSISSAQQGDFR
jgi:SAM-dependent methyltransferase